MKLVVWETDNAVVTVLGTHDEDTALNAAMEYYIKKVGLRFEEVKDLDFDNPRKLWFDPVVLSLEFEVIPKMFISDTHQTAWIPAMIKRMGR